MKQIVVYCDKTKQKTQKNMKEIETEQQLIAEDYEEIKNTLTEHPTKLQPRNSYSNVSLKSLIHWNISQNLQSKLLLTTMKEVEQLKNNLDQESQAMYKH